MHHVSLLHVKPTYDKMPPYPTQRPLQRCVSFLSAQQCLAAQHGTHTILLLLQDPIALTKYWNVPQGAACMLTGTSLAALIAFSIARRTGGGMDFFREEGGGDDATWRKVKVLLHHKVAPALPCRLLKAASPHVHAVRLCSGGDPSNDAQALSKVQAAIDSGDLNQQLLAMTVLRLTPVTPFRYSILAAWTPGHAVMLCALRQPGSH